MRVRYVVGALATGATAPAFAHAGGFEIIGPAAGLVAGAICGCVSLLPARPRRGFAVVACISALVVLWFVLSQGSIADLLNGAVLITLFGLIPFLVAFVGVHGAAGLVRRYSAAWQRLNKQRQSDL